MDIAPSHEPRRNVITKPGAALDKAGAPRQWPRESAPQSTGWTLAEPHLFGRRFQIGLDRMSKRVSDCGRIEPACSEKSALKQQPICLRELLAPPGSPSNQRRKPLSCCKSGLSVSLKRTRG